MVRLGVRLMREILFSYLSQYTSGPGETNPGNNGYPFNKVYQPGLVLSQLPDSSLRWETSGSN